MLSSKEYEASEPTDGVRYERRSVVETSDVTRGDTRSEEAHDRGTGETGVVSDGGTAPGVEEDGGNTGKARPVSDELYKKAKVRVRTFRARIEE